MIFRYNVSTMDQSGIQSLAPLVKNPEDPGYEIDQDFSSLKTGVAQLNKQTYSRRKYKNDCMYRQFLLIYIIFTRDQWLYKFHGTK